MLTVHDISADGRWLMTREDISSGMFVKKPGEDAEIDLSWLDLPVAESLSSDGGLLVFTDENVGAGRSYAVMIRKTDGSPPVKLGDGGARGHGLSPDGKWVAALLLTSNRYVLYPTGAGEPRRLDVPADRFNLGGWFPDSEHVMLCGSATSDPPHCYRQAISGGPMTQLGPQTARGGAIAPNGSYVIAESNDVAWLYSSPDSPPKRLENTQLKGAEFVGWSSESQPFFVKATPDGKRHIFSAPMGSQPQEIGVLTIGDLAGLTGVNVAQVVGSVHRFGYAYDLTRQLSTLLVGSGITLR